MKTTRFLSILLAVLMVLSMMTVAVSAYTVPDGFAVAETPGLDETGIDGELYGLIGDADFNDKVNVKDATTIQKSAASLLELDEIAKVLADVNFDTKVNVIDATNIQKWAADLDVDFPINHMIYVPELPTETTPAETESTPAETESTPAETESTPAETETTPAETESTPAETESTPAETESTPAETETTPVETETTPVADTITVYFTDARGWGQAYIYAFNGVEGVASDSEPFGAYPGAEMTYVETNSYGQDIYSYEFSGEVDYIKFSNGQKDGVNIRTDNVPKELIADNAGFYPAEDKGGNKWTVGTWTYEPEVPATSETVTETAPVVTESTPAETESTPAESTSDETTPVETETTPAVTETTPVADTITVYFTDARGWGQAYIYAFNGVEGVASDSEPFGAYPGAEMTYVETNSYGQDIYSYEFSGEVDYIKFSNGQKDGVNIRTDNVPKELIADNAGFYPAEDKGGNKWTVGTWTYEPEVPATSETVTETAPVVTESTPAETESTPAETESTPAETESTPAETETTPVETETAPADDTITVYFSNNKFWSNVFIYAFYGEEGGETTGTPVGEYPGVEMTYVETNSFGQDIYSYEIPADVDFIKFSDGGMNNDRTANVPNSMLKDSIGFYLEGDGANSKWELDAIKTYEYVEKEDPSETESTPAETETTPAETETTPAETETTPAETEPEVETYTVKFVNGAKWAEVRAYAWNDSATWPGVPMTKTGEKVNGFDVYEVTFDVAYQNIIFNNNNNGSQTADLKFQNGKVYDIKSAKWYDTIDDIPAVAATATDRYLVGSFNGWNTTALEFKLNAEGDSTAYAEIELKANTTYEFKVVREGTWTSYNGTITGTAAGLQFSQSVQGNAKITTKAAGTYVFAFGMNDSKLSVTYPG